MSTGLKWIYLVVFSFILPTEPNGVAVEFLVAVCVISVFGLLSMADSPLPKAFLFRHFMLLFRFCL